MAVEIRELVIRAVIKSEQQPYQGAESAPHEITDQHVLIEACVKQVLKILKRKQER
jgi:hypothetical protein